MGCEKVYRTPSQQVEDRLPISTYEEAIWWLVKKHVQGDMHAESLELFAEFIADMFWLGTSKVWTDFRKRCHEIGGEL